MDEIEINSVRFIIDRLILEDKLDDYYKWFLTLRRRLNWFEDYYQIDIEYTLFTNTAIHDYFNHAFPDIPFEQVLENYNNQRGFENAFRDFHGYFHFDVRRRFTYGIIFVNENFYNNFIHEILNYNNNDNDTGYTLK